MKTFTMITVMTIINTFSPANAQFITGYGFKSGLTVASQDFEYTPFHSDDNKNRNGMAVGAFIELFDLHSIHLLSEVYYVQKGMIHEQLKTGEESPVPIGTLRYDNRVDYISISILAKIFLKTGSFSPYLAVGPRFDMMTSFKSEDHFYDPVYDEFEKWDIGGDIGIGCEYRISNNFDLICEGRYSPSFSKAYESEYLEVKNKTFTLLVGIKL